MITSKGFFVIKSALVLSRERVPRGTSPGCRATWPRCRRVGGVDLPPGCFSPREHQDSAD